MKFVLPIVVIFAVLACCAGYSFLIPAKLYQPGICMYNGLMLKRGDNSLPSSCQNMRCNDDGSILVEGCGHYDIRDCRVMDPVHLDKPYPECCKMNFLCAAAGGEVLNKEVSPLEQKIYA